MTGFVDDDCSQLPFDQFEWANTHRDYMNFTCDNGGIITGFKSDHDNGQEDRKWRIKCCPVTIILSIIKNSHYRKLKTYFSSS